MLQLQSLSLDMISNIYQQHMLKDFPPDELKSLDHIVSLIQQDIYEGYGLFEDDHLCGYAFLTHVPNGKMLLLDYLAVCQDQRNRQYGSYFLQHLKAHFANYDGILIEIESLDSASDADQLALRTRRLNFYIRNGAVLTDVITNCFGVEFSILYLGQPMPTNTNFIAHHLDTIYATIFPSVDYQTHVHFIAPTHF